MTGVQLCGERQSRGQPRPGTGCNAELDRPQDGVININIIMNSNSNSNLNMCLCNHRAIPDTRNVSIEHESLTCLGDQ